MINIGLLLVNGLIKLERTSSCAVTLNYATCNVGNDAKRSSMRWSIALRIDDDLCVGEHVQSDQIQFYLVLSKYLWYFFAAQFYRIWFGFVCKISTNTLRYSQSAWGRRAISLLLFCYFLVMLIWWVWQVNHETRSSTACTIIGGNSRYWSFVIMIK